MTDGRDMVETVNGRTSVGGGRGTEMEVWLTGSVAGRVQKARAGMKGGRGGGSRRHRVVGGGGGGGGGGGVGPGGSSVATGLG